MAGNYENTPWPQLAAQLGVAPRVHFLGFQRDMPGLMRASDLVVFPSRYEPFGLVVLEALASGLPVVTARSTGGAEVMTSDVGFVLDDSEDVGALARALSLLASSDERRADMAIAARRLALQYSWRSMATKYLELLENAAGRTAIV
ncbi:MAG: glycosyltransferase family 4 protein [Candidatus Velthaea sp.]